MIESQYLFQIEKNINDWKLTLISYPESIIINVSKNMRVYQNSFKLNIFQESKLFENNLTSNEIIENISSLLDKGKLEIEEDTNKLKIKLNKEEEFELILIQKELLSKEIILFLINKINKLELENINIKNELNENKNKAKEKIEYLEKENRIIKKDIEMIKKELKIKEEKMDKIEEKMMKLKEKLLNEKKKIQLTKSNLKNIKTVNAKIYWINSIGIFPSGNIIIVSDDKSIKIFDSNFNEIQTIKNAHEDSIIYVNIKDENNFVTCSNDKSIKTWIQIENEFIEKIIIENAHDDIINKVIYDLKGNLYSCSFDETIKIWESKNNTFESGQILIHNNKVYSILLFEKNNILISSGESGTKIWNLKKYECIIYIKEAECYSNNVLKQIDDDRFIVGGKDDFIMKIISVKEKKIIKEIDNKFKCWGICNINDKGVFLTGGYSKDIRVYRSDNYDCIQIVNDNNDNVNGLIELNNGTIISYSDDKSIKIWSF